MLWHMFVIVWKQCEVIGFYKTLESPCVTSFSLGVLLCSSGGSCGVGATQQLHGLLHVLRWPGLPHGTSASR